jgi:hypothetical protein
MKRAVYIGGFGNGRGNAERVADALSNRYATAEPFTFAYAMDNPDVIRRAVRGADVITHSAGMLALKGTRPEYIGAIGAPVPMTPAQLVMRSALKTLRMHTPGIGIRNARDIGCVMAYDLSTVGEYVTNGPDNLKYLPKVAKFDAVAVAIAAEQSDIPTMLGYSEDDEFFHITPDDALRAAAGGVDIAHLTGVHDQLVLTPDETLEEFFAVPAEMFGKPPEGL